MDQPGGGDSGQPFIQNPIENANTPAETKRFYELNRTSLDFPIRGGAISSLVNGGYTTRAAAIDADRIKQFFDSKPQGTAFIQKQKGLQLTNPLTQVPNSLQFAGLSLDNSYVPTTWVYDPKNTLAQVATQGNGTHFNRQGVRPTVYEPIQQTYQYIVSSPRNNTEATNRLAVLRAVKLIGDTNFLTVDPSLVDRLGISTIQSQLFNYLGGPGSNYGIGSTKIFRATDAQGVATSTQPLANPITQVAYSQMALTYAQLASQETQRGWDNAFPTIQDFREQLANDGHNPRVPFSDYSFYNIQNRLGVGSPGAYDTRLLYTDTSKEVAQDRVNMINPFYFNPNSATVGDPWTAALAQGYFPADMIKFAFECMSNDVSQGAEQGGDQGQSVALIFRAFLDGSISDGNQAEFSSFKYLGRGETFRTYQGFDRSISFSFKIFTQTRQEMRPLYKKLNWLMSQVYPDYSPTYGLMRGNVVRVTIGDYIYRMPGFLESVNVTIDNTTTPWEILLNEYTEGDGYDEGEVRQLPHMVSVQCNFKPIMDILPRREKYGDDFVPLIVNRDTYLRPPRVRNLDTRPVTVDRTTPTSPITPLTLPTTIPNIQPQQKVTKENPKKVAEALPKKGKGQRKPKGGGLTLSTAVGSGTYQPTTKLNPPPPPGTLTLTK
jgi:hypothetical protein